jgi:hypothetical protein
MSSRDTADSTASPAHTTATHIHSSTWLWVGRAVYVFFLLAGIVYTAQLTPFSIDFFQARGQELLGDEGILRPLYLLAMVATRALLTVVFILTSLFLFWRISHTRIGLLGAVYMVAFGAGGLSFYQYLPDGTELAVANNVAWGYSLLGGTGWLLLLCFAVLFPDGRFVPPRMIYFMIYILSIVGAWSLATDNPLYPLNWPPLLLVMVIGLGAVAVVGSQVYRYRKVSTPSQRQQTKWVVLAMGFVFAVNIILYTLVAVFPDVFATGTAPQDVAYMLVGFSFIVIPIVLVFAMMRYRLWDADLIINRSLVYSAVALTAVLIFFGVLVGLQVIIGQTQPVAAFLIAAGVSAAIFRPLRNFIQRLIDRYVFHLRFDLNELYAAQKSLKITNPGALSGRKLGRYEVLDLVGKGGMGEVYKAVSDNGDVVAVKTLLLDKAGDPELIQRFQREAQTGMALRHPNIARVHGIESEDGLVFMVMDYLEGQDLHQMLRQKSKLDTETIHEITRDLADALDAAHQQNLVHRDLKPSNVMLVLNHDGETHRAVLMDFGVTKIKDANTLTGTGAIGTIDYMAPEQIVNAREVDHRADLYSLGVMLYEMVTGTRPFQGNPGQVLFAHIQQPPPDPRDVNGDVPRPLAKAIMKALAKNPDDRFHSAGELLDTLKGQ